MTIAEVSRRTKLTADTLRYYERIGLIPTIKRNNSGIREYTEADCHWIHFIKCMRSAGLSIETLIEYVNLYQKGDETIDARKDLLMDQRKQLEDKMKELQNTMAYLDQKIKGYTEHSIQCEERLKENEKRLGEIL